MRKTSSSLPDSYPGLSGSFFIDTSSSGRAGCHPVTPDNIEEYQDLNAGPDITCNLLQIEERFDPLKEYPHLFPEKKPLKLPPLRQPMEIMQHQINIIPESTWMPKWKDNNEMSEYYITQKINKELATGRMKSSQSDNYI